jgi:hypothetical protein
MDQDKAFCSRSAKQFRRRKKRSVKVGDEGLKPRRLWFRRAATAADKNPEAEKINRFSAPRR